MRGKLRLFYFLEEQQAVVPLRSFIGGWLLSHGVPLPLATLVAGFETTEQFLTMLVQLNNLDGMSRNTLPAPDNHWGNAPLSSLRERFIEYIQSGHKQPYE